MLLRIAEMTQLYTSRWQEIELSMLYNLLPVEYVA
jgi:hypothetical protein